MAEARRILVTGATGFIGRHLITDLIERGHHVAAVVRGTSRAPDSPPATRKAFEQCQRVICEDWDAIARIPGPYDQIFHLAAAGTHPSDRNPETLVKANVLAMPPLIAAAKRWDASIVMTGSCAEYADPSSALPIDETWPLQNKRLYGASKAAAGLIGLAMASSLGVPMLICRLFGVYGCGEAEHRLFPSLVRNLRNRQPVMLSEGSQLRDFLWVREVTDALTAAADKLSNDLGVQGRAINICSGQPSTVRQFAETVCERMGADPSLLRLGTLPMRPDDVPALVGSNSEAARLIGWHPSLTLQDAVGRAIEEFDSV